MARRQLLLPSEIVKKSNDLIRGRVQIENIDGARILAALIARLPANTTEFKGSYQVQVGELPGLTNKGGSGYTKIQAACEALGKAFVKIELRNQKKPDGDPSLEIYPFFSRIIYKSGIIEAKFNPCMGEFLLNLRSYFTQYPLIEYIVLPSIYSQRTYEILKSWSSKPEITIDLQELFDMLEVPESMRRYPDFRRFVLEKAHKDISKTTFEYEWEPVKQGRTVVAIRFIFNRKAVEEVERQRKMKNAPKRNKQFKLALACAQAKKEDGGCKKRTQTADVCNVCSRLNMINADLTKTM